MKEFKGTKGEWKKDKTSDCETNIYSETHRIAGVKHYPKNIDKKFLEPTQEEGLANAKLIAAAPELLDALQDLVKYCEENDNYAELELAKEVIKKALD